MMPIDKMGELIERVERASGPDRRLDVLIGCAVGYVPDTLGCGWAREPHWQYLPVPRISERIGAADKAGNIAAHWEAPAYTASIDAAMTLIPETDATTAPFWKLGNDGEGGDPALFKATVLMATAFTSKASHSVADTPALALCAAALKVRTPAATSEREG